MRYTKGHFYIFPDSKIYKIVSKTRARLVLFCEDLGISKYNDYEVWPGSPKISREQIKISSLRKRRR